MGPATRLTTSLQSDTGGGGRFSLDDLSPVLLQVLIEAQNVGAIGPASLEQHLRHALGFAETLSSLISDSARFVDLGSGGGLPGLVLAEVFPRASFVLLEGRTARCEALEKSVEDLGLDQRVSVLSSRAELAGQLPRWRASFDVAVARGFASPAVTAECAAPLLRVGGLLCASEPPHAAPFERWPEAGCSELGLEYELSVEFPNSYVVLRQAHLCPPRYPRRVGVPAKRPLF
jgi:16S rRNA (guanine527-N7)-methyltransferase